MTGKIRTDFNAVPSGVDRALADSPSQGGRPRGPGVDPRLTVAADDSDQQNTRGRERVRGRGDSAKKYTRGQEGIQNRGGKDVDGSGRGGDVGSSKGGGKQMPTMPQVPQQSQQTPQQAPQQSTPQQAPQQSAPQASTPAPTGVTNLDPKLLAALIAAAKKAQDGKDRGDPSNTTRDTNSTTSGQGSATTPQAREPIDVSQVSFDKYAGGPLSEQQTADVIDQALTINGVPNDPSLRAEWQELYQHMAQNESGRDPNAGNGWDSNATGATQVDGLPANSSRGIWQCIPSTFAAYRMAGTSESIYDPVASAAASMNYVMQTYKVSPDGSGLDAFKARQGVGSGSYQGY